MKKFIIIILSILLALVIGFDIYLVYRHHHPKEPPHLDVIPYEHFYMEQEYIETQYTKPQIRIMLDNIYNTKYKYKEVEEIEELVGGYTHNGTIYVDKNVDTIDYIIILAHEVTHIKYATSNETFTEYTSIVTLYESNNILFQKVALNRAKLIVGGGLYGTEYDCGYYLIQYFKDKWRISWKSFQYFL